LLSDESEFQPVYHGMQRESSRELFGLVVMIAQVSIFTATPLVSDADDKRRSSLAGSNMAARLTIFPI